MSGVLSPYMDAPDLILEHSVEGILKVVWAILSHQTPEAHEDVLERKTKSPSTLQ